MAPVLQRFLEQAIGDLFSGLGVLVDAFSGYGLRSWGLFLDGQQIVMSWLGSEYGFGSSDWHIPREK